MNIFFTGCTHYGHKNIVRGVSNWDSGYRDFDSIKDMNNVLVNSINSVVGPNDILYSLGDWSFGGQNNIVEFRERINCNHIHLVAGNHDEHIRYDNGYEFKKLFASYNELTEILVNKQKITLCHYPLEVWDKSHRGAWMLHSHCHGSLPDDSNKKRIDVGFDCQYLDYNHKIVMTTNYDLSYIKDKTPNKYLPSDNLCVKVLHKRFTLFSFDEILNIMSYKKAKAVDNHKETYSKG